MKLQQSTPDRVRGRLWTLPVLIALASLIGLVVGLVGDGVFDALGWVGLLSVLLAIGWAWRRREAIRT